MRRTRRGGDARFVLTTVILIDMLQCLSRNELDTLEVTYGLFHGAIR